MTVLVSAATLAEQLGHDTTPVLADVRWNLTAPTGRPDFLAGHLPGAQWVDLETELSGPKTSTGTGGRHPLPEPERLAAALRRIGVTSDRPVVVYDDRTSLSAARLWWLLTDAGHRSVSVLDGGYADWVAAGLPVETGEGIAVAPGDFVPRPGQREALDADAVAAAVRSGRPVLDVRAAERYAATEDPMDPVAGHVPGAVSVPSMANLDGDGRFLDADALRQRYADRPDPVLYCGSGITAAHSLLALESAGLTGAIYPGSWSDWITDPSRPVAQGTDPG